MKLAIVAGGKGERLGLNDMPKPMVSIGGKPLLVHQINLAKRYGIEEIFVLSGHLSEVIVNYFGDGSTFGTKITHFIERYPLGTAGAVKQLEGTIDERFLVFYGDVLLNIDIDKFLEFDALSPSIATIIVHPNDHPHDSDLVEISDEKEVIALHPKPQNQTMYYSNLSNAAIYILSHEIFKYITEDTPTDFGKHIFPALLRAGEKIRAYKTAEYIKDVGTIERLEKIRKDLISGKVETFSREYKRSAIFMDRDGTLIEHVDLLHKKEDLKLFPYTASSLKKINESGYVCFLVTNQPVVARNICDLSAVREIHKKLETLLGREGAYLNDIYFCPHHPDKGYPEDNPDFKIDCDCRKPKIGMIEKAINEYNVDADSSWFIGDTTADIQTGMNARMKTILLRTGQGGKDKKYNCTADFVFDDLEEAIGFVLEDRHRYGSYIEEIINNLQQKSCPPRIITVAGLARCGKSTFVKVLSQNLLECGICSHVVSLDNWLVGVNERTHNMTVKDRYRYAEIEKDVKRVLSGEEILLKVYDPYLRNIIGERPFSLHSSECLIIDGVPALDIEALRSIADVRIYIEIDETKRRERFFSFYRWKDMSEEEIDFLYQKRSNDEVSFIKETKKYADIIVEVT